MILHLKDGTMVQIYRQTCGYYVNKDYRGEPSCSWNISPMELIEDEAKGFFAIGPWGCDGQWQGSVYVRTPERFQQLIPVRNVSRVSRVGEWEMPETERQPGLAPPEFLGEDEVEL